jgi:hypothetical protein
MSKGSGDGMPEIPEKSAEAHRGCILVQDIRPTPGSRRKGYFLLGFSLKLVRAARLS